MPSKRKRSAKPRAFGSRRAPSQSQSPKSEARSLHAGARNMLPLALFLAAVFALKLVMVMQLKDHVLTQPDAGLDTTAYVTLAQRVLDGDVRNCRFIAGRAARFREPTPGGRRERPTPELGDACCTSPRWWGR